MTLGLIGGDFRRVRPLVDHYRAVGAAAGHPADQLRLAVSSPHGALMAGSPQEIRGTACGTT